MVSFDIFEKNDIEQIEKKVNTLFGVKPIQEETNFISWGEIPDSFQIVQTVWELKISEILDSLLEVSGENDLKLNPELLKKYVKSTQIRGYNSPRLPFYVLLLKIDLKEDVLNSTKDIMGDVSGLIRPLSLFIESFEGIRSKLESFSPKSAIVTQFWVQVTENHINEMRENILKELVELEKNAPSDAIELELPETFLSFEPFNLSPDVEWVHSQIIASDNLILVIGNLFQTDLSGPYIIEMSYDDELLKSKLPHEPFDTFPILDKLDLKRIYFGCYGLIIVLICFTTFLAHLSYERVKIEREISQLREEISSSEFTTEELHTHLEKLSTYGTKLSSLTNMFGTICRQRELAFKEISKGSSEHDYYLFEAPIKSKYSKHLSMVNRGYLRTVANHILGQLTGAKEALKTQEEEICSLQTQISNRLNLRNIKSNESLQKWVLFLTIVSLVTSSIGVYIAYNSHLVSERSLDMAELDFLSSHPQGNYYVGIKWVGYDRSSDSDQFRISVEYLGTGESQQLRLALSFVSGNTPVLLSNTNLEVVDQNIIGRNYIDGSMGEVNYLIPRYENKTGRVSINYYTSDVNVNIPSGLID